MSFDGYDGYAVNIILKQLGLENAGVYELDTRTLEHIFNKMLFSLKNDRFNGGCTISALAYSYIIEFYRLITDKSQNEQTGNGMLVTVLNYIDLHFNEVIALEKLSTIAKVTPQYLCKVFKKNLGMRPLEYVARKRVQHAKHLLISTEMQIKDIAATVGYDDNSYFCAVFKKAEGISPKEYRIKG